MGVIMQAVPAGSRRAPYIARDKMQKLYYNDDRKITARIGEDGEVHEMGERVLIAMSGGVDSSVAAYRMLEAGLCCIGANMRLRRETGPGA